MEGRRTEVLHLELVEGSPADWLERRLPQLLARPGALRASWWENLRPGREDLPRTLDEFPTLGLVECERPLDAPAPPPGVRSLAYRRTARPGQGALLRGPTLGLELVLISSRTPGGAQALRDWADLVHIREIAAAAAPGFGMITPYERVGAEGPRYLHLYEIDTEDAETAFQGMTPATSRRVGPPRSAGYRAWAFHPELVIDYVNTFRRLGQREGAERGAD